MQCSINAHILPNHLLHHPPVRLRIRIHSHHVAPDLLRVPIGIPLVRRAVLGSHALPDLLQLPEGALDSDVHHFSHIAHTDCVGT